ncbi:MAG: hypothetical protein WC505_06990 [Patescibacteria group bacterium]
MREELEMQGFSAVPCQEPKKVCVETPPAQPQISAPQRIETTQRSAPQFIRVQGQVYKKAAANLPAVAAGTLKALNRVRMQITAILGEADRGDEDRASDTVCISNVPGEFQVLSADALGERAREALELLYNSIALWERSATVALAENEIMQHAYVLLNDVHGAVSEAVESGINAQPGFFCVEREKFFGLVSDISACMQAFTKLERMLTQKYSVASVS